MADEDTEVRTRAQLETALKEAVATFNKIVRNLNKITRSIHDVCKESDFNPHELKDLFGEYKSILDELSNFYDRILELSLDSPPEKVVEVYERIDTESCKFLSEVSAKLCKVGQKESFDRYKSQETEFIATQTRSHAEQSESISKLCSQLVLNRLPTAEPEVFSGDPLQYNDWINSFEALVSSRSVPDSKGIFYLKKYLSGEAKACVQG